jgi:hypothetical protein
MPAVAAFVYWLASAHRRMMYPLVLTAAAAAAVVPMIAKSGSSINHLIELKVFAALAMTWAIGTRTPRPALTYGIASALLAVTVGSFASRSITEWGPLRAAVMGQDAARRSREEAAALVAALPKPVFSEDSLYAQPWIATGNRYPAIVPDDEPYGAAKKAGLLTGTLEEMIERRFFASLVLTQRSAKLALAKNAGYAVSRTVAQPPAPAVVILLPSASGAR